MATSKGKVKKTVRSAHKAAAKKPASPKKVVLRKVTAKKVIAKKGTIKRVMARKSAPQEAVERTPKVSPNRMSWLDAEARTPVIDLYAQQLDSFISTIADGKVDEQEVQSQEARLVKLMQEIEPQLDDVMHAKITQLLCELTAYDIMQVLHTMQQAQPHATFQG